MELGQGQIGSEAKYSVVIENGKLLLKLDYAGQLGGAGLYASVGARQVLDALKAAIPGVIDDALINAAEAALGL